jgi:hypothetical protein
MHRYKEFLKKYLADAGGGDGPQEVKYIESWPSTTSAWAGWSRFDFPVDGYGGVHSLLGCTGVSYLPLG